MAGPRGDRTKAMPILINGTSGDDRIDLKNDLRGGFEVWAGAGDDEIFGSPQSDLLIGGDGDDSVKGGEGDDTIYGWDGHDALRGNEGNDLLVGGEGDDYLEGDNWGRTGGNDTLFGGEGNDQLFGGAGDDSLDGGNGEDYLSGGPGNDTLAGGGDTDVLTGWSGDDTIDGGDARDLIFGSQGRDTLTGGAGPDQFHYSSDDLYPIAFGNPFLRLTRHAVDTDRITDFDTMGTFADVIWLDASLVDSHTTFRGNDAADAIAQGYIYWLQSGSGAALKTTVYLDLDGGNHRLPGPFVMGQTDLAIATLDGVAANQLNASHFIV